MTKISPFVYSRIVFWLLLLCGLLFIDSRCQRPVVPEQSQSKKIKAEQAILAERYEDRIKSLQHHSDSLARQLKTQQQQLAIYKQQVLVQKLKVQQRITRQTLQRDTLQKLIECDSLKDEVQVYITLAGVKDSLCEVQVHMLTAQLSLKDSVQNACTSYADQLNLLVDASTDGQQQLEKQVSSLNEKLKNKTRAGKLLTAGILVLSGVMLTTMTH